ncbi:glycosyltransferase family 4 protein [Phormidium nigroviride]
MNKKVSSTIKEAQNSAFGVNISGFVKGEFGLGEGVRANIRSIKATGLPFTVNSINVQWHRNLDPSYKEEDFAIDNPYAINLVNVNAESLGTFIDAFGRKYFQNRYNIGCWAWELPTFPPEWRFAFDFFDEIWTYSNHSAEAIAAVSPIPVIKVMPSLDLPRPLLGREALGLPKDKFIFLFMFDCLSTFERKNPEAVIEAFIQAFGKSNKDVVLVIKFSNSQHYPNQRDNFKALAAQYSSVHLIEGHLMREEVNALVYHCDCYVSLHRAEGFGLTMAEAMFYGKPVIATAYSSNMEFMNVGNSFLVKYDLIELTEEGGPYKKGNVWAEPDIEHAAVLMHYVFHNYQQAQQVGVRAACETKSLLSPQAIGRKVRTRLEYIMGMWATNDFYRAKDYFKAQANYFESQAQAWKNTAQQVQVELEQCQKQASLTEIDIKSA